MRPPLTAASLLLLAMLLTGCRSTPAEKPEEAVGVPLVRVRLMSGVKSVQLAADGPPTISTSDQPAARQVVLPGREATVTLAGGEWQLNGRAVGHGTMTLAPAGVGQLSVGGKPYRGFYVFEPADDSKFDVVNHVSLENYLDGVVAKEMPPGWQPQAYRAQAVAARTYALYEIQSRPPGDRSWDVSDTTASQVYGGIDGETDDAIDAVQNTAGLVLAYGPAGDEKIFKTYFSSCCGGVTASAQDVFDGPDIPPLAAQAVGDLCSISPVYSWPDVKLAKPELTRRLRAWGRGLDKMAPVDRIEVVKRTLGRPVGFVVIDAKGGRFPLKSDEFRTAVNASADRGPTLRSGFCTPVAGADAITFTDGHGWGHGVGLCQWCAQARAEKGMSFDAILAKTYPQSKLVRAY